MPGAGRRRQSQSGNFENLRPGAGSPVMRFVAPSISFMPRISLLTLLVLLAALPAVSPAANNKGASSLAAWEHSIVSVEVARKQYDYYQPWSKRTHKAVKTGTVLADH